MALENKLRWSSGWCSSPMLEQQRNQQSADATCHAVQDRSFPFG
jgi:hypothetical protein